MPLKYSLVIETSDKTNSSNDDINTPTLGTVGKTMYQ